MHQTLFKIPQTYHGVPIMGFGVLLALVVVLGGGWLYVLYRRTGSTREVYAQAPLLAAIAFLVSVLLPRIAEPDGLAIRGFGVATTLGVLSGVWMAVVRARRRGVDPEVIYNLAIWLFVGGVIGARLFYVIEYWQQFRFDHTGQPLPITETLAMILRVDQGGLVVYGAAAGALVSLIWFVRRHKLVTLPLLDLIAPSLMIGLAFGRVGCFLNGCCFGGVCDHRWAVEFPAHPSEAQSVGERVTYTPPYARQVERGLFYGVQLGARMVAARETPQATVVYVVPGSPAAKQGVQVGDHVESIGGQPADTISRAVELLDRAMQNADVLKLRTERGEYTLPPGAAPPRSLPVHPTQLYSVLDALLIMLFLFAYEPFKRRDGELIAWMISIYAVTRFLVEIIRTDESAVFGTGLSISQNISLMMIVVVAGLWYWMRRHPAPVTWPVPSAG
ncbi:MAG: prolipoprotein diacylglyceryl transferase [Planctomycetes bacterium]|nr:prolipoprotein diacylglyceryl transferase [Planctomycetota bacterium]